MSLTARTAETTTQWTAELIRDGREPSESTVTLSGDNQRLVRIHFAFDPSLTEESRNDVIEGVGQYLANAVGD